ncbi:MAG: IPT/TIG domain-containing protein [Solirubrobacterales bacterium]
MEPELAPGEARASFVSVGNELSFNADVVPIPGIGSVVPAVGSVKGGTRVTVAGHDLSGATAIALGGVAAAAYTIDSDPRSPPPHRPLRSLGPST